MSTVEELVDDAFEELCHALACAWLDTLRPNGSVGYVRRSLKYVGDGKADAHVQHGSFTGSREGLVLFSYKGTAIIDRAKAERQMVKRVLRELPAQKKKKPVEIVIFLNRDLSGPAHDQIRAAAGEEVATTVFGPTELKRLATRQPHILWRWFEGSPLVRAVLSDDADRLQDALGVGDLPGGLRDSPRHPIMQALDRAATGFRFVGAPGSGKSTAIGQYCILHPGHIVVLVSPGSRDLVWNELLRLTQASVRPVIVVFRDFHRMCRWNPSLLQDLFSAFSQASKPVKIVVEYRTSERLSVSQAVAETDWKAWGLATELSLDGASDPFLGQVLDATCTALEVCISESMRSSCLRSIRDWDGTPLAVVEFLRPYRGTALGFGDVNAFYPLGANGVEDLWAAKFQSLVSSRESLPEAMLLRILGTLRVLGLPTRVDAGFLRRCSADADSLPASLSQSASWLAREGWFTLGRDGVLLTHDLRISLRVVQLLDEAGRPSDALRTYARQLVCSAEFPERAELASGMTRLMISHQEWAIAQALLGVSGTEHISPGEREFFASICLARHEDPAQAERGRSQLAALASRATADPRPAIQLVRALLARGARQEASDAVHSYLIAGGAPERLRVVALKLLFEILDISGAIAEARSTLMDTATTPELRAAAIAVLAQSGCVREAEKDIAAVSADCGDILALAATASICAETTSDFDTASGRYRAAIRNHPGDPDLRLLFASFVARRVQPSELHQSAAICQAAHEALTWLDLPRRLFTGSQDVLADMAGIEGLLLIAGEKEADGLRAVRRALSLGGPADGRVRFRLPIALAARGTEEDRRAAKALLEQGFGFSAQDAIRFWFDAKDRGRPTAEAAGFAADAYAALGLKRRAEETFREGLAESPADPRCAIGLANLLSVAARSAEAAEVLRRARRSGLVDGSLCAAETHHFLTAHDYMSALECAQLAVELDGPSPKNLQSLGAAIHFGSKDYPRALSVLTGIEVGSRDAPCYALLLSAAALAGDTNALIEAARACVSVESVPVTVLMMAAKALFRAGDIAACELAARALARAADSPWEYSRLAAEVWRDAAPQGSTPGKLALAILRAWPSFQPLRQAFVPFLVASEFWEEALGEISQDSTECVYIGYGATVAEILRHFGLLDQFLEDPETVLEGIRLPGHLAVSVACAIGRHAAAIRLVASWPRGAWVGRGGRLFWDNPGGPLVDAAREWLTANPEHHARWLIRSVIFHQEEGGLSELESILLGATQSGSSGAELELLDFWFATGRLGKVVEFTAERRDDGTGTPHSAILGRWRAMALSGLGRAQEALDTCDKALAGAREGPLRARLLGAKAAALREIAQLEAAGEGRALYQQAVECASAARSGNALEAFSALALVASLLALGRTSDACKVIDEEGGAFNGSHEIFYAAGPAFRAAGRLQDLLDLPGFDSLSGLHCSSTAPALLIQLDVAEGWAIRHATLRAGAHSFQAALSRAASIDDPDTRSALSERLVGAALEVAERLGLDGEVTPFLLEIETGCAAFHWYWCRRAYIEYAIPARARAAASLAKGAECAGLSKVVESVYVAGHVASGDEYDLAIQATLANILRLRAVLALDAKEFDHAARIAAFVLRMGEAPDDGELGLALRVCASWPIGVPISADSAPLILNVCEGLDQMSAATIGRLTEALGRIDFAGSIENARTSPVVTAALLGISMRREVRAHPAIIALTTRGTELRSLASNANAQVSADRGSTPLSAEVNRAIGRFIEGAL